MKHFDGELAGVPYGINFCETETDAQAATSFAFHSRDRMALDTESTTWDVYDPTWRLRLFQFGHKRCVFVLDVEKFPDAVGKICRIPRVWTAHNSPHDVRTVNRWAKCKLLKLDNFIDTYLMSHIFDSRGQEDGGIGHGLKDIGVALVDRSADDGWNELKKAFKEIRIPIPGQVYKSGPRRGQQKHRAANLDEGWALIPTDHPAYWRYAGMDVILGMHVLERLEPEMEGFELLLEREHRLQRICEERMHAKGFRIDVPYLENLSRRYGVMIDAGHRTVRGMGLANLNSPQQVVEAFLRRGAKLTKRTETGNLSADRSVLQQLAQGGDELAQVIQWTKKLEKAKSAWIDSMLARRDSHNRVHAGINTLTARTARMSIDTPPMQQLPADDHIIRSGVVA